MLGTFGGCADESESGKPLVLENDIQDLYER